MAIPALDEKAAGEALPGGLRIVREGRAVVFGDKLGGVVPVAKRKGFERGIFRNARQAGRRQHGSDVVQDRRFDQIGAKG